MFLRTLAVSPLRKWVDRCPCLNIWIGGQVLLLSLQQKRLGTLIIWSNQCFEQAISHLLSKDHMIQVANNKCTSCTNTAAIHVSCSTTMCALGSDSLIYTSIVIHVWCMLQTFRSLYNTQLFIHITSWKYITYPFSHSFNLSYGRQTWIPAQIGRLSVALSPLSCCISCQYDPSHHQ